VLQEAPLSTSAAKDVADRIRIRADLLDSDIPVLAVSPGALRKWADLLDPPPKTKKVVRLTVDVEPTNSTPSAAAYVARDWVSPDSTFDEISIRDIKRKAKVVSAEVVEVPV